MIVTGLIHGALGATAIGLAIGDRSGGGEGGVTQAVDWVLGLPGGRWLLAVAALCTLGAGVYYVVKGAKAKYREHLRANRFTGRYDPALRAGVVSQGLLILIIGGFLSVAAFRDSDAPAGGLGQAFDWLANQPFGNVLVILLCLGLLGFAFFCFVNAAYRIVPKVRGSGELETLGHRIQSRIG
jgi:hypothetical protein